MKIKKNRKGDKRQVRRRGGKGKEASHMEQTKLVGEKEKENKKERGRKNKEKICKTREKFNFSKKWQNSNFHNSTG